MEPILVTGVGGGTGGVGTKVVELLVAAQVPVRALAHHDGEALRHLRAQGVEVVLGDLTDLGDVHHAMAGCKRLYLGMGLSPRYLEATVNVAAVARARGIACLVAISQMTISQMSVYETTPSPQQKLHWLSEQVLQWSGLPVSIVRPTVFLENPFFFGWAAESICRSGEIRLPFGEAKSSPVAAVDVARVIATILLHPEGYVGGIFELTGPASETMADLAAEYADALGRDVHYVDVPLPVWEENDLREKALPAYVSAHIATMAALHHDNRYDRRTDDVQQITGRSPMTVCEWVRGHRNEFACRSQAIHKGHQAGALP